MEVVQEVFKSLHLVTRYLKPLCFGTRAEAARRLLSVGSFDQGDPCPREILALVAPQPVRHLERLRTQPSLALLQIDLQVPQQFGNVRLLSAAEIDVALKHFNEIWFVDEEV